MKTLYPELPARVTGTLPPEDGHTVWFEESGNPDGIPVVFVHGGPGGGTQPLYRRFFDPDRYRIVLFDQRGCGRSTPHAELEHNNTWALVSDMERLREHLDIKAWVVFGGSWGSTLSLAYSQNHPDRCLAIILRGIFLLRQQELEWFYQDGANRMFPDAWQRYYHAIPEAERDDLLQAYYRRLTHDDPEVRIPAARAWATWEASTSKLIPSDSLVQSFEDAKFAEAFARIEAHYFVHGGFLDHPDQLIHNVERIRHIPGFIVQGRYDVVCPPTTAWMLHRAWPEADFHLVPDAGHSAFDGSNAAALVAATDRFANG